VTVLADGLLLMFIGMGTVLIFLLIMSGWIALSSKFFSRPRELAYGARAGQAPTPSATPEAGPDRSVLLAVITAAIQRYRSEHHR